MNQNKKAICTTVLIVVNIAVFLLFTILGKADDTLFLLEHGAMYEPYVMENHEYYRLITCMFLHFSVDHLLNNMVMLGALGYHLEPVIGKVKFLIIYFVGGIGGSVVSMILHSANAESTISAGASGAIFALLGALVCAAIQNHGRVGRLSGRGLMIMAVLSVYFGFASSGVDNAAHIGGLICGFLLQGLLGIFRIANHKEFPNG